MEDFKCPRCELTKELNAENFYRHSTSKTGYQGICKQCQKEANVQWQIDNKKERQEYMKEYYQENHETLKERARLQRIEAKEE